MSFVSSKELATEREKRRSARRECLETEREKFIDKQRAFQRHKDLGHDKWMLPSIEKRIEEDTATYNVMSKEKTHKKKKKKKKRKRRDSSNSDHSESENEWQEKAPTSEPQNAKKEPENWLTFDAILGDDKTYTSASLKEQKITQNPEQSKKDDVVGQHSRELNPYWKDGGTGMPEVEKVGTKKNKIHKEWLLRSLKRMNEQAKEQNKSIESVAAERYGSWEEFQRMLCEADPHRGSSENAKKKKSFVRPSDEYDNAFSDSKRSKGFRRPRDDDDNDERRSSRSHKRDKHHRNHKPSWKISSREEKSRDSAERSNSKTKSDAMPKGKETLQKCSVSENPACNNLEEPKTPSAQKHSYKTTLISTQDSSSPSISKIITDEEKNALTAKLIKAEMLGNSALVENLKSKLEKGNVKMPVEAPSSSAMSSTSQPAKVMSEKEKNQISARILKAELIGNKTLAEKLKTKLDAAKKAESDAKSQTVKSNTRSVQAPNDNIDESSSEEETVVLTRTGKDGQSWPLQQSDLSYGALPNKRRKKTKIPTHKEGERERYFGDDDRYSLSDLVRREKTEEAEDQHEMFSRLASNQFKGTDSEYFTLDDMFVSQASRRNTRTEEEARQKQKAMANHKKLARRLECCQLCFGNKELPKHLLIAIGKKCYLMLPNHRPISEGQCLIVPMHHCNTGTSLDEDVWYEMKQFMRSLISMFKSRDMDCVFMQTCLSLKKSHHFFIDCIPLPDEEGHLAPIYFKKAIQESESEWSHNKKLVDTRGKEVQNCIPKGLPYFSVDFGMDGGFAHVVEDEALFPSYFGREIIGGMLDVEPRLWRHPHKEHFSDQTKRSVKFSKWWKAYDWTSNVTGP